MPLPWQRRTTKFFTVEPRAPLGLTAVLPSLNEKHPLTMAPSISTRPPLAALVTVPSSVTGASTVGRLAESVTLVTALSNLMVCGPALALPCSIAARRVQVSALAGATELQVVSLVLGSPPEPLLLTV